MLNHRQALARRAAMLDAGYTALAELVPEAIKALGEVLRSEDSKPGDRIKAAECVLTRAGLKEPEVVADIPASRLSDDELEQKLREAAEAIANGRH